MSSPQTLIDERLDTITIPVKEYAKLLEYKSICQDVYHLMKENGGKGL